MPLLGRCKCIIPVKFSVSVFVLARLLLVAQLLIPVMSLKKIRPSLDKAFDLKVNPNFDGFSLTDWPFKVIDSVWCCHGDSLTVITFVCQGV